jgi:hypothetical protein
MRNARTDIAVDAARRTQGRQDSSFTWKSSRWTGSGKKVESLSGDVLIVKVMKLVRLWGGILVQLASKVHRKFAISLLRDLC